MKMLALEGGGVYGDLQAFVLRNVDALDKFDCFVGTSIGSAILAAISLGMQDKVTTNFFHEKMPIIFSGSLRRYWPFNSKYSDEGLNNTLQDIFGGYFLKDAKKPLFVTAANVGARTLKVFNSTENGWLMWEVIRCATAAETYFPSWKGYADGGVFANNPSMVGVAAAVKILGVKIEDIELLSIGTGDRTGGGSRGPKSIFKWGIWLVNALLDGASDKMHDYFVRSMPIKRYVRLQFPCRSGWKMDSPADMLIAETVLKDDLERAAKIVEAF